MIASQQQTVKKDRYPHGWWLIFKPKPRPKRGGIVIGSPAAKIEERPKAIGKREQAETAPTPLQPCTCTQSSIALRSANAAPGAAATLNLEVTEPNLLQPKKEPKETVKFDELKSGDPSTGDSPSSPASSTSSKKRVHFVDDAESSPSTPDFETLSVASDDSQTDIPFMSPKDRCRIRRSSILDDSNTASAMQQSRSTKTYMLRPNSEHFSPGEPRILLMLRGERALRDAKRALRDGTWREKYTESQMYRVLE